MYHLILSGSGYGAYLHCASEGGRSSATLLRTPEGRAILLPPYCSATKGRVQLGSAPSLLRTLADRRAAGPAQQRRDMESRYVKFCSRGYEGGIKCYLSLGLPLFFNTAYSYEIATNFANEQLPIILLILLVLGFLGLNLIL